MSESPYTRLLTFLSDPERRKLAYTFSHNRTAIPPSPSTGRSSARVCHVNSMARLAGHPHVASRPARA
jgi:hypothetical protein